eukprot:4754347-Pyramimonas_sp.AAC.1
MCCLPSLSQGVALEKSSGGTNEGRAEEEDEGEGGQRRGGDRRGGGVGATGGAGASREATRGLPGGCGRSGAYQPLAKAGRAPANCRAE